MKTTAVSPSRSGGGAARPAPPGRPVRVGLVLALICGAFAPAVRSQTPTGDRTAMRATATACQADFALLCKGVRPGQGRALACLHEHQDELSPGCKSSLEAAQTPPSPR